MEKELTDVMNLMRGLSTYEKTERGRQALASKRSTLGILSNDRFALQSAYNARKKALAARPKSTEVHVEPTADVPRLPESVFDTPVEVDKVPTLEHLLSQPTYACSNDNGSVFGAGRLLPLKVKLIARRSLRCVESDTMLYKGMYWVGLGTKRVRG